MNMLRLNEEVDNDLTLRFKVPPSLARAVREDNARRMRELSTMKDDDEHVTSTNNQTTIDDDDEHVTSTNNQTRRKTKNMMMTVEMFYF